MSDSHVVRIQLPSSFELLDLVQILSDRMTTLAGLGDDAMHWVSVAVRESVINAIKHGNKEDRHKHVTVEFLLTPRAKPSEFVVEVLDEGAGFDPDVVANPLTRKTCSSRADAGSSSCAASWTMSRWRAGRRAACRCA
jgi:serine/threonine-protein kinase RsbW